MTEPKTKPKNKNATTILFIIETKQEHNSENRSRFDNLRMKCGLMLFGAMEKCVCARSASTITLMADVMVK